MNALLALPDLQPERLFVRSGDVRLAVHCWGAPDNGKPTLLMVHGYPDNHETWLPLIRQLAGRYRIVAYDVRGAGASTSHAGAATTTCSGSAKTCRR